MDIKELAKRYKEEIPEGLDEIRFLKSVYIKLGKERVFDEKYFFGSAATMKKIYALAERNKHNREFQSDKRDIICCSLSYIISHLMEEFGYSCFVTPSFENGEHVFPIIQMHDGRRIKFDLQRDLENIQTYCHTQYFATADHDDSSYHLDTIDEQNQTEIDIDINYIESEDDYKDNAIDDLKKRLDSNPDLSLWERLSIVLSPEEKINRLIPGVGYVECFKYYRKRILPKFFSDKELSSKVHFISCSKESRQDPEQKEYTNCIYLDDKSSPESIFIFSRVHNRYILTPFENVIHIQEEGLNIGTGYPNNGATKLKRQLNEYLISKSQDIR